MQLRHCLGVALLGVAVAWACKPPRRAHTTPTVAKEAKEGMQCKQHDDCQKGLRCVHNRCAEISGKKPPCPWVKRCLDRLAQMLARKGKGEPSSAKVVETQQRLSQAASAADCHSAVADIARWFSTNPFDWKLTCGPPPLGKQVKLIIDKSDPFEMVDIAITNGVVPGDASKALRDEHRAYPDVCKAQVNVNLKRDFQGYVFARFFEQHGCVKPTADAIKAAKKAKADPPRPTCKTRPYERRVRRYLPLQRKGSNLRLSFYVSTPPPVCSPTTKPNLSRTEYKTGCYCLGIDKKKFRLEWQDEPFLLLDVQPKRPE